MKKLLYLIFFIAIIFTGFNAIDTKAQEACSIQSVNWTPNIDTNGSIEGQYLELKIETLGDCDSGLKIEPHVKYKLDQSGSYNYDDVEILKQPNDVYLPAGEDSITVKYVGYEDGCYEQQPGYDCKYYTVIKHQGSPIWNGKEIIDAIPDTITAENAVNFQNGILFASCGDGFFDVCDPDLGNGTVIDNSWEFFESNILAKDFKDCLLTKNDISFTKINQVDDEGVTKISGSTTALKIKTANKCTGIPLRVYLKAFINNGIDRTIEIDNNTTGGDDFINIIAEEGKDVVINLVTNDDACYGSLTPDCWTYVSIETADGNRVATTYDHFNELEGAIVGGYDPALDWFSLGLNSLISSIANSDLLEKQAYIDFIEDTDFKKGVFVANCTGTFVDYCNNENWLFKSMTGGYGDLDLEPPSQLPSVQPKFDEKSPCYVAKGDGNDQNGVAINEEGYDRNCYEFLAPIPGFGDEQKDSAGNATGRVSVSLSKLTLGDYINSIFQIALGILMVLAVIMIVVAGVQYMTSEAIFQKQVAKESITKAVSGLILGLGIFVILNTINPELLKIDFGSGIKNLNIATVEQDITINPANRDITGATKQQRDDYLNNANIYCPRSGGSAVVKQVAESFVGKSTYRLGGKYWNLSLENPQYAGKDVGKSCDINSGTICIDCSGFSNLVLYCAGIIQKQNIGNGGTSDIFGGVSNNASEEINTFNKEQGIVNGIPLVPGDLLGKTGSQFGHVGVYIGNGEIIESTSDMNGRSLNQMTRKTKIVDRNSYIEEVLRVSNIPSQYTQ